MPIRKWKTTSWKGRQDLCDLYWGQRSKFWFDAGEQDPLALFFAEAV